MSLARWLVATTGWMAANITLASAFIPESKPLASLDNRHLFVQMNVEKALAVYMVRNRGIKDTGQRIPLSAGPTSIRSQPR